MSENITNNPSVPSQVIAKINFPRLAIKERKCFYNNVNSSFRLLIKNKNEILKLQELKQLVISRISGM